MLPPPSRDQRGLDAPSKGEMDSPRDNKEGEDEDLGRAYSAGYKRESAGMKEECKLLKGHDEYGMSKKYTRRVEDIREEKARLAMEEEERRVAALTFDDAALLPFSNMCERAKYIPLRLSYDERKVRMRCRAGIYIVYFELM